MEINFCLINQLTIEKMIKLMEDFLEEFILLGYFGSIKRSQVYYFELFIKSVNYLIF